MRIRSVCQEFSLSNGSAFGALHCPKGVYTFNPLVDSVPPLNSTPPIYTRLTTHPIGCDLYPLTRIDYSIDVLGGKMMSAPNKAWADYGRWQTGCTMPV